MTLTPEELWKLAYRLCEARLRKTGPVFSEAEILEDFPVVSLIDCDGYHKPDLEDQLTEAFERKIEESKE
jgi:hypothetical protein